MKHTKSIHEFRVTVRGSLWKHVKSVHEGFNFPCDHDQCDYKTAKKSNLFRHIESKHEGFKVKFSCDQCDYRAKQKYNLMRHINSVHTVHTGVKFPCDHFPLSTSAEKLKS